MKKSFVLIVLCLCFVLALSGCGKTAVSKPSNTTDEKENVGRVIKDLGQKTITIATTVDYGSYVKGESQIGDSRINAFEQIEKELNCKIDWVIYDNENLTTKLTTTALSGDKFCDLAITVFWNTASLFTNKVITNLNKVESIDLSADYWDSSINDLLSINGIQRAASCGLTCTNVNTTAAVVFNKRILNEMGLENPYALVKEDKWTISKLREMAKKATKDLDGVSGMTKNDQFGITTLDISALTKDMLAADGFEVIKKEPNGLFEYNMSDANLVTRLKYYQDFVSNDQSIYTNKDQDAQHAQFRDGKALFYIFQLDYLGMFTDMKDEYGVVPFPKGEGQKDYIGLRNWNTRLLSIPVTLKGDDLYDAGCVMQAIAYYTKDDNETVKNEIIGRYLRDEDSIELLDVISNSAIHTADLFVASPRFPEIEMATIVNCDATDPTLDYAQKISENKNTARSLIQSFNASISRED